MAKIGSFYPGNWIESFPEHHQWSNATLVTKGMAPWGAVALGEIDQIIQALHARQGEAHAWWEEWCAMAARLEVQADTAAAEGRSATAGNYYLRAGNYYYTGERMVPPSEEKTAIYRQSLRCYQEGLRRRHPNIETVDVPYEGGALPAYFLKSPYAKGRAPTVVVFDGLDNCKEMSVLFAGLELAFRGFHVLAIDGPGQGEALRLRGFHARYDSEKAGTPTYEYLLTRDDVDPDRVALMAYSAGGYYAPRMAAFEPRYAALIAWGAHYDYHAVWQKRWEVMQASAKSAATSHFQLPWVLGEPDMDAAMKKLKKFTLAGVAHQIKCPILICHGQDDTLSPPEIAQQLHDNVGSTDRTLKIFTARDGGSTHVQVDNRQVGIDYIADWLEQRLHPVKS